MEPSIDRKICFKLFTVPGELISHISSHTDSAFGFFLKIIIIIFVSIIVVVVFILFLFLRATVAVVAVVVVDSGVVQRSPFI